MRKTGSDFHPPPPPPIWIWLGPKVHFKQAGSALVWNDFTLNSIQHYGARTLPSFTHVPVSKYPNAAARPLLTYGAHWSHRVFSKRLRLCLWLWRGEKPGLKVNVSLAALSSLQQPHQQWWLITLYDALLDSSFYDLPANAALRLLIERRLMLAAEAGAGGSDLRKTCYVFFLSLFALIKWHL